MKKIKKISIRLTQEDYYKLFEDYIWQKETQNWSNWLNHQEIKSFSGYIRVMLKKGLND